MNPKGFLRVHVNPARREALIIVEASSDDNSVVALHHATMDRLKLFRGDTVELTGRKDCMHCARGCHV